MATALTISAAGHNQGALLIDGGRPGLRDRGIRRGGPADPSSAGLANELLSQPSDSCCLEITLAGGRWLLSGRGQLALTGAQMGWKLDGAPLDRYSVIYLDGDHLLTGEYARAGCRAYLAIRGSWQLPRVLGSVEGGLPGLPPLSPSFSCTVISEREAPFRNGLIPPENAGPGACLTIPAATAPEWRLLPVYLREWLCDSTFTVQPASNRQGIRLLAPEQPAIEIPPLLSSPVLPGTVQLTPKGPILLGPDAQTVGGYPRVLQVARYGKAFQLRPGQQLRFTLPHRS